LEGKRRDQPPGCEIVRHERNLRDDDAQPLDRSLICQARILELQGLADVHSGRFRRAEPDPPVVGPVHRPQEYITRKLVRLAKRLILEQPGATHRRQLLSQQEIDMEATPSSVTPVYG